MKRLILLIEKSQTINEQFKAINSKLDNLDEKITNDNWLKTLAVIVPIIVGILVFFLTRKKEVRFKKAEVAGEIFMRLHELKNLRQEYRIKYLEKCACDAYLRLQEEDEKDIDFERFKKMLSVKNDEEPDIIKNEIENVVKELMKYLGQYKFYISKKDKKALNMTFPRMGIIGMRYELFENCKTPDEIMTELEKLFISKIIENDDVFESSIKETLIEIENLIDK